MAINVFLIVEHTIICEGIMALMELEENLFLVGSDKNYQPNNPHFNNKIDVLLIELNQTFPNPIQLIKEIQNNLPKAKIIILSDHEDSPLFLKEALEAGISGYMTKNASAKELSYGIDKVTRTGLYICTAFIFKFINNFNAIKDFESPSLLHNAITKNEMEILFLVAEGLTNNDIAQKLCVSVRTIEMRRYKLLEKTNTNNMASLIRYSMRTGLIK